MAAGLWLEANEPSCHADSPIIFVEDAARRGLRFEFDRGSRGRHDLPEVMGGGVALLDADGDGRLDVFFCNGGPLDQGVSRIDSPCRFFRGLGAGNFVDATEGAEAPGPSYAMGAAVGDYDGDGRPDLFVTGWRDQRLYRNLGGGRFRDVTAQAHLSSGLWSTSAAFADLDGDGDLDLYVAGYLDYEATTAPFCAAPDGRGDYCGPEDFPAQPDRLYRNDGDGSFTDVSGVAGIDLPGGRGLGVLIAELTGDTRPDIYVANDGSPCWLFANRGGLKFVEVAQQAGLAGAGSGLDAAAMGVALGDLDGDGRSDLVVTNFLGRSTLAFRRLAARDFLFEDASARLGLSTATWPVLGFGVALADFDGDGRLDLIQANGHVLDRARLGIPSAMKTIVLRNDGNRLADVSEGAGPWFRKNVLGRGLSVGDVDRDGRPDVVINVLDAPAALLLNESKGGAWVTIEPLDKSNRPATGARVRLQLSDRELTRELVSGGSYLSASEPRIHVGVGAARTIERLDIAWPWGRMETWRNLPCRGFITVREGTGTASQ